MQFVPKRMADGNPLPCAFSAVAANPRTNLTCSHPVRPGGAQGKVASVSYTHDRTAQRRYPRKPLRSAPPRMNAAGLRRQICPMHRGSVEAGEIQEPAAVIVLEVGQVVAEVGEVVTGTDLEVVAQ